MEKKPSKQITKKNKKLSPECRKIYAIGDSIRKPLQGFEISKSPGNCKTYM